MYYGSYLVFPYVIWLIWRLYRQPRVFLGYVVLLGCLLFAWARFVEPQMITIQETQIAGTLIKTDIALIYHHPFYALFSSLRDCPPKLTKVQ